jgi:hypothetical protein
MAKEAKSPKEHKSGDGGKSGKKKRLTGLMTHVADDGSFVHEHHYRDHKGQPLPPSFGGVSTNMEDLQQHMQDHLAPASEDAQQAQGAPEGGDDSEAPAAGGGPPQAQ